MKTALCSNCGKNAQIVRRNYRLDEMGLPVELERIEVIECSHCGNVEPIIPNMDGLMQGIALALVCRPCKLNGEEVRFLRKYVGKSAKEFSRYLHVNHTHLSKIENGRTEIGDPLDKLVRLLVVNMNPDLERSLAGRLMKVIPEVDDSCSDPKPEIRIDPANLNCEYA